MFLEKFNIPQTTKKILFLLFLFSAVILSQADTTFCGLRGYEDSQGNTQLFYRFKRDNTFELPNDNIGGLLHNDIFHFDVKNNIDSLFILDFFDFHTPLPTIGKVVSDFEFVDNSLTDFYQCGDAVSSFEPSPIVVYNREYDNSYGVNSFMAHTSNIEITRFNSDVNIYVHASGDDRGIFTDSTDRKFDLIETTRNYNLVSVNGNQPNIMFVENDDGYLLKSTDTGLTFHIVDSSHIFNSSHEYSYAYYEFINRYFLYDFDRIHIYRVVAERNGNHFIVSSKNGELNSWEKVIESESEIFISNDYNQSGLLYLATGKEIYESNDYGMNFQLFKQLNHTILGLYKKPNSDILYVTTSHSLLKIILDEVKVLKNTIDYKALSFYPLHIGDKWYYNVTGNQYDVDKHPFDIQIIRTVLNDTTMSNGINYYKILETRSDDEQIRFSYERIDTANGKVFKFDNTDVYINNDLLIYDFSTNIGDTIFSNDEGINESFSSVYLQDTLMHIFDFTVNRRIPISRIYSWWSILYDHRTFTPELGLTRKSSAADGYDDYWFLEAASINGNVYGDTSAFNNKNISLSNSTLYLFQNESNPNFADTTWLINGTIDTLVVDSILTNHNYSYQLDVLFSDETTKHFTIINNILDKATFSVEPNDSAQIIVSDPDLCPICKISNVTPFTDSLQIFTNSANHPILLLSIIGDGTLDTETDELPNKFSLSQNYPNPFNPSTIIKYSIPSNQKNRVFVTNLEVFNILGQNVSTLVNQIQKAGDYEVKFDASGLTSGIYFCRLTNGSFNKSIKMLFVR
jgi:type IX secretion system substrate protein